MANVSRSNSTSKVLNTMVDQELTFPLQVSYITNIIFNSISCPFTVLLNVLVILAVKSRPRLQSKPNNTDAITYKQTNPRVFNRYSELGFARPVCLFCTAPDTGDLGETCSDQIHHELPLHCDKQKYQAGSDCILDRLSFF